MYKDFMTGNTDSLTYAGKTFTEKPFKTKSLKPRKPRETDSKED